MIQDLAVPAVIREILDALTRGVEVPEDRWDELELQNVTEAANSASYRPGRDSDSEGASPYARAHHNLARLTELLAMWRDNSPKYPEIAYVAGQIEKETQLWPASGGQ